ncbi:MAG: hypothetical protein K5879_08170 [Lachnospiraceae bacterium]|nr:hypothetical protein [Lachnospiraceae bacterium]
MFQVKKKEYVNKTFRIERELLEKLCEVAQQENISVNELVVQCCEYALDDMKAKGKNRKN